MKKTDDVRIKSQAVVDPPRMVLDELPASEAATELTWRTRAAIADILQFKDPRLLVITGPCSIHDPDAALEYGEKLKSAMAGFHERLVIVMRVYFEKPRTRLGWKGLINDPDLDGSYQINKGLRIARKLLLDLAELGVPAGTEFLDIVTGQYISDLISWGAIGARTTESQVHREMASGLSCPIGFKNGTDGTLSVAVDAMFAAREPHIFLSPTKAGQTAIYTTTGNPDSHIILRGGKSPNYQHHHVRQACELLTSHGLPARIMIDASHANSNKEYSRQPDVIADVARQISQGEHHIIGVMMESHLHEGRQPLNPAKPLKYGVSITDACLAWDQTLPLLEVLAQAVEQRKFA